MNKNNELLQQYQKLLKSGLSLDSSKLLTHTLNLVMKAERELHNKTFEDTSNGYYQRSIGTPYGAIEVEVPRSR